MFYFEAIDLVIEAITERFDQPGYRTWKSHSQDMQRSGYMQRSCVLDVPSEYCEYCEYFT